ncbi:MAG: right-handed parallel beta-helix repeat-containing protein [Bryobacteraceae bacterium]|jgi:hypothetical protein
MSLVKCVSTKFEGSKTALNLAGIFLIVMAATAAPAQAAFQSITTCNPTVAAPAGSLINAPGDYQLTTNLTQTTIADCILITASNVSLKLNRYQITSTNAASTGSGIDVNPPAGRVSHVGIEGPGLIQGFENGIFFTYADYCQVDLVTAANNSYGGIVGFGVTFLTAVSNVLVRNGNWGLTLGESTGGTIQYNEANGNGAATGGGAGGGIAVKSSIANTLNNNTASANGPQSGLPTYAAGILIDGNSNRVYGNSTDGNILTGIQVTSGSGNQIFSNTSSVGNGRFDLEDDNVACDSDVWGNNGFFNANRACIH